MSIPSRLSGYLDERGARYEIREHLRSRSSAQTARSANIAPHELAKSVIVEDAAGCVMAILPADRRLALGELARLLGRKNLRLADENRVAELFTDCDRGAVPAIGMPWGVETVVDDEIETSATVYIESGDHEHLLVMHVGVEAAARNQLFVRALLEDLSVVEHDHPVRLARGRDAV